ncbi:MAG: kelch repeat-containing protein, partial [Actinomycetota bacterium]
MDHNYGFSVRLQNDGKIVFAGGSHKGALGPPRFSLFRFNPDGSPDSTFDTAEGPLDHEIGIAFDMLIQPDGKIVAAGGRSLTTMNSRPNASAGDFIIARVNSDGSADDGGPRDLTPGDRFGTGGVVHTDFGRWDQAFSLALQPSGGGMRLLAGGCSSTNSKGCVFGDGDRINGQKQASGDDASGRWTPYVGKVALARYKLEDGSLDQEFGQGGKTDQMDGGAVEIEVLADGYLAAAIRRTPSPGANESDFEVARFEPNGLPDTSFGSNGIVTTKEFSPASPVNPVPQPNVENFSQAIAVQPDGRIVAAGASNGSGFDGDELILARYLRTPTALEPDLSVSISDAPDPVTRGDNLEYRIQVENRAPTPAFGVGLIQAIPQGLTVLSATSDHGGCSSSGTQVSCGLGSMLPGAKATVTLTALVGAVTGTVITSTAEVASGDYRKSATADTTVGRPAGEWTLTKTMAEARSAHSATALSGPGCGDLCGKVLVAGGRTAAGALSSAEIYDPAADSWSPAAAMGTGRFGHTATLLPSGKVMVAGGATTTQQGITSVEIFDPASGTWTQAVPMLKPRYGHTATLLHTGKVLIAGGQGTPNSLADAELYSPGLLSLDPNAPGLTRTGATEPAGSLNQGRSFFTATLLPGGKVLAVGGFRGPRFEIDDADDPGDSGGPYGKAEIYDPRSGQWSDARNNAVGRWRHTATALKDGRVLVAGGNVTTGGGVPTDSAEIYNAADNSWAPAATMGVSRFSHTATLLPDGNVLVAGGRAREPAGQAIRTAELFAPSTGGWKATAIM